MTVVVAEITFKVAVVKINFKGAEITLKVIVANSSEVKITFIVVYIFLKVAETTSLVAQITL